MALINAVFMDGRPLQVEYEGVIYHVMNRGDHSKRIYRDDGDAKLFIKTIGEACLKSD